MRKSHLSLEQVEALARGCLMANGCDSANAEAVAATVTAAERDGAASHGLFRIPGYVAALRSGKVNGRAQPKAEDLAPATLRMDGDGGFAPLAHRLSRPLLAERARTQGLAALGIVNVHHFSALWVEVEALAADGLVRPSLAPATRRRWRQLGHAKHSSAPTPSPSAGPGETTARPWSSTRRRRLWLGER